MFTWLYFDTYVDKYSYGQFKGSKWIGLDVFPCSRFLRPHTVVSMPFSANFFAILCPSYDGALSTTITLNTCKWIITDTQGSPNHNTQPH
eukprot:1395157-Amorphochlora_amoeboformis.AAC.1